jgi:nitroreductase
VEVLGGLTADFYRQLNAQAVNPVYRFLGRVVAGDTLGKYFRNYYASVSEALREWDEEGTDRLFHGAVAAILVTGRRDAGCPGEDALLATQNILLAAHAMGLGSCLIGFVVEAMRRRRKMCRCMAIPAEEEIYSVIGLGYPAIRYRQVTGRRPVRPRVLHLSPGGNGAVE